MATIRESKVATIRGGYVAHERVLKISGKTSRFLNILLRRPKGKPKGAKGDQGGAKGGQGEPRGGQRDPVSSLSGALITVAV